MVIALIIYGIGWIILHWIGVSEDWTQALRIAFFVVFGLLAGICLAGACVKLIDAFLISLAKVVEPAASEDPAAKYHRRYVVPGRDLDREAQPVWIRATGAMSQIQRSEVVTQQLIDSVQVTVVMPHHMWRIAEQLARLSALRTKHSEILHGVDPHHPDVAAVLDPQRTIQASSIADIERHVRSLEEFAGLLDKADGARLREQAVRQLATLNDPHADLLARQGRPDDLALSGSISQGVQAVIEQADEAVRQANEAGRSLILPEQDTRPDEDTDAD